MGDPLLHDPRNLLRINSNEGSLGRTPHINKLDAPVPETLFQGTDTTQSLGIWALGEVEGECR